MNEFTTDRFELVVQIQEVPVSLQTRHVGPSRVANRGCYLASRDGRRRDECGKPREGVGAVSRADTNDRVMSSLQATVASKRVCCQQPGVVS